MSQIAAEHANRAGRVRGSGGAARRIGVRGFTLIELSIVLTIIAVIAGLAIVGLRSTMLAARNTGEQQMCRALKTGVEQFKQQFGFLPPLIDDFNTNGPYEVNGEIGQPLLQVGNPVMANQTVFLATAAPDQNPSMTDSSGNITATDLRLSTSALPIYLVGAADAIIDGADGPGFTFPQDKNGTDRQDGHFRRAGKVYDAMFDVTKDRTRLVKRPVVPGATPKDSTQTRYYLIDRWNQPIRYYRWTPIYYTKTGVNAASDPGLVGQVKFYNVPVDVELAMGLKKSWTGGVAPKSGDPLPTYYPPELRSATFAIISLGADGVLGANPKTGAVDDIVELGQ